MKEQGNYKPSEKELRRIQEIIAKGKIKQYIKKYGHEPYGDLSEFYQLTDEDIEPYRIHWFCQWFWNQNSEGVENTCFIDKSVSNATIDTNNATVEKGSEFIADLNPLPGYEILPENVLILMGGEDITDTAFSGTSVYIPEVTDHVSISIVATVKNTFTVTVSRIENATFSGQTGTFRIKDGYHATIIPDEGYNINSVVVRMGGQVLSGVYADGEINIPSVNDDVDIEIWTAIKLIPVHVVADAGNEYSGATVCGINLNGSTLVPYGGTLSGNVTPTEQQTDLDLIISVLVGGNDITENVFVRGRNPEVVIENIKEDVSINLGATYHAYDVTVEYLDESGETISTEVVTASTKTGYNKTIEVEPGYGLYRCEYVVGNQHHLAPNGVIKLASIPCDVFVYVDKHVIPDNELLYFNADGVAEPNFSGITIVSNVYDNGIGVLTASKPITDTTFLRNTMLRVSEVFLPNSVGSNINLAGGQMRIVHLPETTYEIPSNAFRDCTNLTGITGLHNVVSIKSSAFANVTPTSSLTLSDMVNLSGISSGAFAGVKNVNITNAESIVRLTGYAFSGVTGSVKITGAKKLERIESDAFHSGTGTGTSYTIQGLESLNYIARTGIMDANGVQLSFGSNMPDKNIVLTGISIYNSKNVTIDFGKIKSVAKGSFQMCTLNSLNRLKYSGIVDFEGVFGGGTTFPNVRSVEFGPDVTSIGDMFAVSGRSATTIKCYSAEPPTIGTVNSLMKSWKGTLHAPIGTDYSTMLSALGINWKVEYDL